jgi:hypothetical protein
MQFFLFQRTSKPCFDPSKKVGVSLGVGLNLVLPILKPCSSDLGTFFSNSRSLGSIQKLGLVPCTHYTLPFARYCMGIKFITHKN